MLSKAERQRRFRRRSAASNEGEGGRGGHTISSSSFAFGQPTSETNRTGSLRPPTQPQPPFPSSSSSFSSTRPAASTAAEAAAFPAAADAEELLSAAGIDLDVVVKTEQPDDDEEEMEETPRPSSDEAFEQAQQILASLRRMEQQEEEERQQQQLLKPAQQEVLPARTPSPASPTFSDPPSSHHQEQTPPQAGEAHNNSKDAASRAPSSSSSSGVRIGDRSSGAAGASAASPSPSVSVSDCPSPSDRFSFSPQISVPHALVPVGSVSTIVSHLSEAYDSQYSSVPFGANLLKEIILCSLCGVPISAETSITSYRLMIERVAKVAGGSSMFTSLPHRYRSALLRHNADMMVLLQGALFFQKSTGGFDQVVHSMGAADVQLGREIMETIQSTTSASFARIEYSKFNSIQRLDDAEQERRFQLLMQRVGTVVAQDPRLMKLISYIVLFATDNLPDPEGGADAKWMVVIRKTRVRRCSKEGKRRGSNGNYALKEA